MGVQSQNGHILVVTQAALDAYSDPGDPLRPGWLVPLKSGAINADRDLLIPDAEIGGNRDIPAAHLGPVVFTGDLEMYARPRIMYPFIKSASMGWAQNGIDLGDIGSGTPTAGSGSIDTPACVSIEQQVGSPGDFETTKFYNVVCNSWSFSADSAGLAMFTASMIGQYQYGAGSPTTPTSLLVDESRVIPTSGTPDPAVGGYVLVTFAPATADPLTVLPAKTVTLNVTNNIEDDDFRLGSLYLAGLSPKRREVSGTIGVRPQDAAMWKQATWGNPSAGAPLGMPTYGKLVVTLVGDVIPGTGLCQTFSMSMIVALHPFTLDPSGDDVLEYDIDFTAMFPDGQLSPATSVSFVLSTVASGDPEFR